MMKKRFKLLLLMLAILMPTVASAYDFEVDGIYYNKNGTEASVTFKDTNYNSYRDTVNIPRTVTYLDTTYTVTRVGTRAFENCSALRRVTFPNTITEIEYRGFFNCTMLYNISLPSSLRVIGSYAFQNCSRISSPNIYNVTSIGDRAFYNTGSWFLHFDKYLTSIGTQAFGHCNIYGITVASNNPVYDSRNDCDALIETATNTIIIGCQYTKIPNTVTAIGDESFDGCDELSELIIPNSVTYIGSWAFLDCTNLRTVVIPNSVTTIKNSAFCYCYSLDNVVIPFSVTELGVGAFFGCHSLTKITIPYTLTKIGDATFADCYGLTSVTIPNSITVIDERAFQNCRNLTSIDIPNTVTSLGKQAFLGCDKLREITIPESVTSIGESVFLSCDSLKHITLSKNITEIPRWAFSDCRALACIDLHEGITTIGYGAFDGCYSLTNVTIPSTITKLDPYSYFDCRNLKSFIFNAVNCSTIGQSAMNHTVNEYIIGDGVEYIPAGLFPFDLGDKILTLPNSVKVIAANAIKGKAGGVVIGDNIEEIGVGAFSKDITVAYVTSSTPLPCSAGAFISPQTLYVPSGSRNRYLEATGWNEFANIIEQDYIRVTDIQLDNSQLTLPKGESQQLNATILPDNASNQLLTWVSEDESIATVTADGLVTAIGPGETNIIVAADNLRALCHVTVPVTLGQAITLNHDHLSLTIGETASLIATVSPEITDKQYVEWIVPKNEVLMTQETNDNTLDIAALHKGRVAITARTTDGSNLSATCMVTVLDAGGEDVFYLSDMEALHGDTIIIPVAMSSTEPIMAFQTDIYLPEGFSIVTDEDDEYLILPSGRMTSDHFLMTNNTPDGAIRVICYSPGENAFTGNNGDDLFYITVAVPDDASGDYTIQLKNSLLTTNLFQELSIPDVSANIEVRAFLPGDANDSRTVTVTDIVVSAQYILNLNPSPFIFEAADMNNDGNVTVTDIMMIAHLILYPTMNAPRHAPVLLSDGDRMMGDSFTLMPGETRTVSIELDNQMYYSAFQLDLQLPDGLSASNFAVTDRAAGHAFDANRLENGNVRALCYSPAFEAINGNSGALLTFDVTATGTVTGNISVEGIELVTTNCQTVLLDGFTIGVNMASAVYEPAANVRIYSEGHNIIVETPAATTVTISDVMGRANSVNLTAGRNVIPATNGIHIVTVDGQTAKLWLK